MTIRFWILWHGLKASLALERMAQGNNIAIRDYIDARIRLFKLGA
jgi:hypothetical protein